MSIATSPGTTGCVAGPDSLPFVIGESAERVRSALSHSTGLLERLLGACERNRSRAIGISLLLATAVAIFDHLSGDEFPLIICYLPSVIMVCWAGHVAVSAILAVGCCTGWLVDDLLLLEEPGL
ncbi:MAG: hypothetical protein KF861_17570, partial [Planctomycetaceae bacterium]|nr:hypothetical protein [Planctomycetaceae bacterium]